MNLISALANPMQHCENVVWNLCGALNIKVTRSAIQKDLPEHPDYPSLLSISDVIQNYGIANVALRMKYENLQQLSTPFIVHIANADLRHDLFAVVHKINTGEVLLYHPHSKKKELLSAEEFNRIYKGTVLVVEPGEEAGEKDYKTKHKIEKRKNFYNSIIAWALPVFTMITLILVFILNDWRAVIYPGLFTFLTLAGCIIGVLLLWHEVDEYNPAIKEICHGGKKINCSAILNSKAAKVFGISWSVLGSTYFIGMLISLLAGGITNTYNLFLLSWINLIALPYIIYSISYQYFVAKQWCVLCLAVQAVLFLQFLAAFAGSFHSLHNISKIPYQAFITIAISFLFVFIALLLLIPALEKAKDSRNKSISLQRLKHNPQIFEALLARQKSIGDTANGLGITIGNPNAKYRLTKVCNPYCGPCAKAHAIIEELLENNDDLQIQIIFTATDKEGDPRANPVNHLLAVASYGDEKLTKQALNDWYNAPKKEYDIFAAKYGAYTPPSEGQGEALKQMSDWCVETKIAFTPTFFVNGRQLPEMCSVADLKYFLIT